MNASADTSTLLTWLMTGLVVATAVAGVAVVVCAVAVVAARLRAHAPAADPGLWTSATVASGRTISRAGAATNAKLRSRSNASADMASDERRRPLPIGAEAALNAIVELRPDPRNVVVTHRDPTGEVRLYPLGSANDAHNRLERSA